LAEYAANYWFIHARTVKRDLNRINQLGLKLLESSDTCFNWIRLRDLDGYELGASELSDRDVDRFGVLKDIEPPLYYAALAGLTDLAGLLLENGADLNADGGKYGNALQAASMEGYSAMVLLLLRSGAEVNAQSGQYCTALLAACSREHEEVVKLLLENDADANISASKPPWEFEATALQAEYGTAHQVASVQGNEAIVRLLLANKANVNAEGGKYSTALRGARGNKHAAIVKLLLEHGADERGDKQQKISVFKRPLLQDVWQKLSNCLKMGLM
jgi:ankyrin repeat protein